ncbi:hypothetical protein RND71_013688 [Anisodus tanguticus]|uniref:DUF7477 domain-containing protein n=1 Tax=Anisodus tanguticus TaxID=243964 RepID=A0AAE1SAI9_9SOLA|nr:hypothetical protein RND71_013688 [Anisodus tanguticus]
MAFAVCGSALGGSHGIPRAHYKGRQGHPCTRKSVTGEIFLTHFMLSKLIYQVGQKRGRRPMEEDDDEQPKKKVRMGMPAHNGLVFTMLVAQ